jgi:hypothetical protein
VLEQALGEAADTAVQTRTIYHPLQRDTATLLESSEESGGTRTLLESGLQVGGGNAPQEPVTFLVELAPGHAGFERALQIGYGLAADGQTNDKGVPKNLTHAALLFDMSEISIPGAMAAIGPVLRVLARRPAQGRRPRADRALLHLVTQVTSRRRPVSTS